MKTSFRPENKYGRNTIIIGEQLTIEAASCRLLLA